MGCGTCAAAEIHDELDESRHWPGYLWYHQQDTESMLASPAGAAVERLLDEVVFPVLRKHGMRVEWNRKQSTRILLTSRTTRSSSPRR